MPLAPSNTSAVTKPVEQARLAALLREAQGVKGVSLGQDAWRRLKKSWGAMTALVFLGLMFLTALLTPLLPLQSPLFQRLDKKFTYKPPTLAASRLNLDVTQMQQIDAQISDLRRQFRTANQDEQKSLREEITLLERKHPVNRLWTKTDLISHQMIRLRLRIFGNWSLPSLCGTDELGRDVLARICWGARVSLMVGLVATFVSLFIGVTYGALAGYLGGWADTIMMQIVDILYSIPFIFLVIFVITVLSEPTVKTNLEALGVGRITLLYILIGTIYWLTMARVVRGQVISLKNEPYIDAARTAGAGTFRILFRHLIPNVLGVVIVYLTLTIPSVILFESFLSFLGLGVQPPDVSLGLLVNDGVKVITPIRIHWWLVLFPGLVLALTLLALNFLGDGLRDALDPRLKNR